MPKMINVIALSPDSSQLLSSSSSPIIISHRQIKPHHITATHGIALERIRLKQMEIKSQQRNKQNNKLIKLSARRRRRSKEPKIIDTVSWRRKRGDKNKYKKATEGSAQLEYTRYKKHQLHSFHFL